MVGALVDVAFGLALASVAFLLVLVARRLLVARRELAVAAAEDRLRPLALDLVEGEAGGAETSLSAREAAVLAALLARYARQLSGASREHIARFFERGGYVEQALDGLGSRRAWRRAASAQALGDMGSQAAVRPLIGALDDPRRDVRSAAARSLGRLGAAEAVTRLARLFARQEAPRAVTGQALLAIGPAAVPRLHALIGSDEADIRAAAVQLIGLVGDAGDVTPIVERLRDGSADVRARACRALGRLGADEAAGELRAALEDRIPFVRATAAIALGALGDRDAVPLLLSHAGEPVYEPAKAAAEAASSIDPRAVIEAARRPGAAAHLLEAADLAELRAA